MVNSHTEQNTNETSISTNKGPWWLVPVIPAIQEAVDMRITFEAGPRQKCKTYPKNN
jgi:hypothetical protein